MFVAAGMKWNYHCSTQIGAGRGGGHRGQILRVGPSRLVKCEMKCESVKLHSR